MVCNTCEEDLSEDRFQTVKRVHRTKTYEYPLRKCKSCVVAYNRSLQRAVRLEGIAVYGSKCACCDEAEEAFLTLEHKYGRKDGDRTTGYAAWAKAKRNGWPDDYEVLCFNCNCAKGIYGVCPHNKK